MSRTINVGRSTDSGGSSTGTTTQVNILDYADLLVKVKTIEDVAGQNDLYKYTYEFDIDGTRTLYRHVTNTEDKLYKDVTKNTLFLDRYRKR
jgi:hypothetical protein